MGIRTSLVPFSSSKYLLAMTSGLQSWYLLNGDARGELISSIICMPNS